MKASTTGRYIVEVWCRNCGTEQIETRERKPPFGMYIAPKRACCHEPDCEGITIPETADMDGEEQ